jgi:hypothetical protein
MKQLIDSVLGSVSVLGNVFELFIKFPQLQSLEIEGTSLYDDGDFSYCISSLTINGVIYDDVYDGWEIEWLSGTEQTEVADFCTLVLVILAAGEEAEDLDITLTREEVWKYRTFVTELYKLIPYEPETKIP